MTNQALELAVAETRARIRPGFPWWLRMIVFRGTAGITIGRQVFVDTDSAGAGLEALLWHELAHVRQINRLGAARFYWRYFAEYFANRRAGMTTTEAYGNISFEREAREDERLGMMDDV